MITEDYIILFMILFCVLTVIIVVSPIFFPTPPSERQKELCTHELYYYSNQNYDYCDRIGVKPQ